MSPPFFDPHTLQGLSPHCPVLIAGPTASGKSGLALRIAEAQGGRVINADASQVYDCWRIITARPSVQEESRAPHALYGHISDRATYSAGHWLRNLEPLLQGGPRPIIVGGTGLYFTALTEGLAEIPAIAPEARAEADALDLATLRADLDANTAARIDLDNRARVQRAWEVQRGTGRALADWQDETGPPLLPLDRCLPLVLNADRDWLNARISVRFDQMLAEGALDEVAAVHPRYDPALPAHRAIGVPDLMAYLDGRVTLDAARASAVTATRRYAKRQRTWGRSRGENWLRVDPATL